MNVVHTIAALQDCIDSQKKRGKQVGFVPTMGNLHGGHLTLVSKAQSLCDCVVVSIYVNPLQFGPNEDYDAYPRTLEQDCALLEAQGVDIVYAARTQEIYPEGSDLHTHVSVDSLDGIHCGKSRPGFFRGIATVVTKLFNIVRPNVAVFGEKDFQQLCIIRKMVRDMCLPVKVVGAPIARDERGLALSSRNGYLTREEREVIAPRIYALLQETRAAIQGGERDYDLIRRNALAQLAQSGIKPDYFNICNPQTLLPATAAEQQLVILVAGYVGKARLIDNSCFSIAT